MGSYKKPNVCPHNEMVACTTAKCERCGWDPTVAKKRLDALLHGQTQNKEVKK